uniref:Nucleolar complex protein 2 -like protein n=1 Tax=Sarcoptes scabiei TaxID=52283 RepID=A0A834REY8_SARSC
MKNINSKRLLKRNRRNLKQSKSKWHISNSNLKEERSNSNDEDPDSLEIFDTNRKNVERKVKKNRKLNITNDSDSEEDFISENGNFEEYLDDDCSSLDSDGEIDLKSHKKTLASLEEKDPEFYRYLQQHDRELLEFDDDDDDDDERNSSAEDQADFPDEADIETPAMVIDKESVEKLQQNLQNPTTKSNTLSVIRLMVQLFRRAVNQTIDRDGQDLQASSMINPSLFNKIVKIVLFDFMPALRHYLRFEENASDENKLTDPRRSKNWKKLIGPMKIYLNDVFKMMYALSIENRIAFQRHILELIPFFNIYRHLLKRIIRSCIDDWHSSTEKCRELAFLILYRIIRTIKNDEELKSIERLTLINHILRQMYLAYAIVSKKTTEITIEQIKFLRNTLIELYHQEYLIAYQQAFIFMRQLSINLRKSVKLKEKNNLKSVFNWQFIHSINLWSQLIGTAKHKDERFRELVSPIVHICLETLIIFQASKYLPFRLHIIDAMIKMMAEIDLYIPLTMAFTVALDQILSLRSSKKIHKTNDDNSERKSLNLDVMIKIDPKQSTSPEYIELVLEKLFQQIIFYLKSISHYLCFKEITSLFCQRLKSINKPKENAVVVLKLKQLVKKCEENAQFILSKRSKLLWNSETIDNEIRELQNEIKRSRTPLIEFYEQWKKINAANLKQKQDTIKNKAAKSNASVEIDSDYEIELNEEEMRRIQNEIKLSEETNRDKLNGNKSKPANNNEIKSMKRKPKKRRNKNLKKARPLRSDLELTNAFDISSDENEFN